MGGGESASGEEAPLEFAECMRAHGVEMEDPKAGQKAIEVPGDHGVHLVPWHMILRITVSDGAHL